jgi:hypothetical protein
MKYWVYTARNLRTLIMVYAFVPDNSPQINAFVRGTMSLVLIFF